MKNLCLSVAMILLLAACAPKRQGSGSVYECVGRGFPYPEVPSVCNDPLSAAGYLASNYWKGYLRESFPTDSARVLGVSYEELEKAVASWISCLEALPLKDAQKDVDALFSSLESHMGAFPGDSLFFLRFTELVSRYLYDPNSPVRDEDLFLPFAKRLALSRHTRDDMRPGYEYQALMCAKNQRGTKAADFAFKDAAGRRYTLYGIRAELTLILFSNPGCHSCKDIIAQLCSRPYLKHMIEEKRLAILNIYIDEELDKWREYLPEYPKEWISGYDYLGRIREEQPYDVRAIPSLYLLDAEKRVLMKDAPVEKVLLYLDNNIEKQ